MVICIMVVVSIAGDTVVVRGGLGVVAGLVVTIPCVHICIQDRAISY